MLEDAMFNLWIGFCILFGVLVSLAATLIKDDNVVLNEEKTLNTTETYILIFSYFILVCIALVGCFFLWKI